MTEQLSFKLNGKEVTVPKGWTVMQAVKREGLEIPHFCWHPALSVAGVCRFCLVEVAGRPKLEIACNLPVIAGLEVNTVSDKVKNAHKWALEFHLVNHPLDCPICDQAGECGLQNYYMEVGKYKSQMTRPKVLKPKALDLGSELILDTERCILCSRCVRFEEEVTKTNALGIFDRGDRAIIGTYGEEKIEHNYQANLVDICPVGAFTSKRFRFRQRVWFLTEKNSICPGCSTGCSISVHAKPEERMYYRIKPVEDNEVNKHWMCDKGRHTHEHQNLDQRLEFASYMGDKEEKEGTVDDALRSLALKLSHTQSQDIALLVSAQYTNEEYKEFFQFFVNELHVTKVFQWREPTEKIEDFDGILLHGDRNANTQGLKKAFADFNLARNVANEFDACLKANPKIVIALCPEVPMTFPSLGQDVAKLAKLNFVSLWTCLMAPKEQAFLASFIPLKSFFEKKGTVLNRDNKERHLNSPYPSAVFGAKDVAEVVKFLRNEYARLGKKT